MKCAWEASHGTHDEKFDEYVLFDEQIEKDLKNNYEPHQVIVDRTSKHPIKFTRNEIPTINIIDKNDRTKIYPIQERAPIIAKLDKPIYVFRIYANDDVFQEVEDFVKLKYQALRGGIS
jgi:hypothetical protein